MVAGWFKLPTLPSVPQGIVDLLDTSPQVFYPPSRPSSRAGPPGNTSCPSSPSPRRRPRPLSTGDARMLFVQPSPLPPFNPTAHPHTDSPLETTRQEREGSGSGFSALGFEQTSPLLTQSTFGGAPLPPPPGKRPSHRRSQSLAPCSSSTFSPTTRTRPFAETRNTLSSTSAASLPTLDEDMEARGSHHGMPPPLSEPLWQTSLRRTQTLPRGRRGGPPSIAASDTTASSSSSSTSLTIVTNVPGAGASAPHTAPGAPPASHHRSNSTISFSPRRARSIRRGSTHSLAFTFPEGDSPSPMAVSASTSVSDIAALATLSQDPVSSSPLSRSKSVSCASDRLRERLRTLNKLDPIAARRPSIPSPQLPGLLSPATPRSAHVKTASQSTPTGPECRTTPGSSTPTTAAHGLAPPSPTPTRPHRPLYLSHNHRHSLPDALLLVPDSRASSGHSWWNPAGNNSHASHSSSSGNAQAAPRSTTRMRQPQLQMSTAVPLGSRRGSMLELPVSPLLSSSPGSLMSDTGSGTEETNSPTTSVEDLALGPAFTLRPDREREREHLHSRELPDVIEQPHERSLEKEQPPSLDLFGRRTSRDLQELTELRDSLRQSTSSLRGSVLARSKSLRDSTHSNHSVYAPSTTTHTLRSSLREGVSRASTLRESPRSSRHAKRESWHGFGTGQAHFLSLSTNGFTRERRDSLAKDLIHHPTHGTRVVVSTHDREDEDRFLDFDDI